MTKSFYTTILISAFTLLAFFPGKLWAGDSTTPTVTEAVAAWPVDWQWQNGGADIYAVHFADANHGWGVGSGGLIVQTSDGGLTWGYQASGVTTDLFNVQFVDATTGWAIGRQGVILYTTNGGAAWQRQSHSAGAVNLEGLFFLDRQQGWIGLPNGLLKTTNGGQSWSATGSGITLPVRDIQFFDNQNGVLVTNDGTIGQNGNILITANGGATWSPVTCLPSPFWCSRPWAVHFPSPNLGIAVGGFVSPYIVRSTDGGKSWQHVETEHSFISPTTVHFVDDLYGWATDIDFRGGLLLTTDGGLTWSKQGYTGYDIRFVDRLVGYRATSGGIYRSTDGGLTWSLPDAFQAYMLEDVSFVAANAVESNNGWAVGDGIILQTRNGGASWAVQRQGDENFTAVHFIDDNHGWTVGANGVIRATTNGGATWLNQSAATTYHLHDVHFVDTTHGWIAGAKGAYDNTEGKVWRTTDGGITWAEVYHFRGDFLEKQGKFGIDFINRAIGYVVGIAADKGSIHKSTDGGLTWMPVLSGNYPPLKAVDFIDAQEGWAVGDAGAILHTSDGGATWRLQASPVTTDLTAVAFANEQIGYALGGGSLLQTTDGGQTWSLVPSTAAMLDGVALPTPYHAWVVGAQGTIRAHHVAPPALAAGFRADTRGGAPPLTVAFTDSSFGAVTSRRWDFGDGGASTEANPVHVYDTLGAYTVVLTVNGPAGSHTLTRKQYITVAPDRPTATFVAQPTSGPAALTVAFTDNSGIAATAWQWDFGDGGASTEQNPRHVYEWPGQFTVKLTVSGPGGSHTLVRDAYITVTEAAPVADFTAFSTEGPVPLRVSFWNASLNKNTEWQWDFGDGATSNERAPVHIYTTTGNYTVTLTVQGPGGSDTLVRPNFITAFTPPPQVNFTAAPTRGAVPLTVQFTDQSVGAVSSWDWQFGDGMVSEERAPTHTYTIPGIYSVRLTVSGPNGTNSFLRVNLIYATGPGAALTTQLFLPVIMRP